MAKMRARVDFKAVALFVTFESEYTRKEMEDEYKVRYEHMQIRLILTPQDC